MDKKPIETEFGEALSDTSEQFDEKGTLEEAERRGTRALLLDAVAIIGQLNKRVENLELENKVPFEHKLYACLLSKAPQIHEAIRDIANLNQKTTPVYCEHDFDKPWLFHQKGDFEFKYKMECSKCGIIRYFTVSDHDDEMQS